METRTYAGNPDRYDPDFIGTQGTRLSICQRTVGEHSLPGYGPIGSVNRPVRTRMPWWCGEGELKTPLYPIMQPDRLNHKIGAFLFISQISPTQLPYITTPYKPLTMPNLLPGLKAQFVTKKVLSLRKYCSRFLLQSLIQ